jgi:hypothetical protein
MADKPWKCHERDVAKLFSGITGTEIRRNSCRENADNRERNSDVDVKHPMFQVRTADKTAVRDGLTIECKYSSGSFKMLYKWLKDATGTRTTMLIVNGKYMVFWLSNIKSVWAVLWHVPVNTGSFFYNVVRRSDRMKGASQIGVIDIVDWQRLLLERK